MPQVNGVQILADKLPEPVYRFIVTAGKEADKLGYRIYLVGGIVRDLILSQPGKDIDIMVEGNAPALARVLTEITGSKKMVIHAKFGTATFHLDNYRLDFATCRSETYSRPGALPSVKPGTIQDDLLRRDFTVNAIAININPSNFGEIVDLYGGLQDLSNGLIRILHDNSFQDDATRIMRAVRYEQRLNFRLENNTEDLLKNNLDMLDTISPDRLKREVILWLNEKSPELILKRADELGILRKIHRSLRWNNKLEVAFRRAHQKLVVDSHVYCFFSILAYQLDEPQLDELLQRLNMRGTKFDTIARQAIIIKQNKNFLIKPELTNSELYFHLCRRPLTAVQVNWFYPNHHLMRRRLNLFLKKLYRVRPFINGKTLHEMGVKPGPIVGEILNSLLSARLDGIIKTRKEEEQMVGQFLKNQFIEQNGR